MINTNQTLEAQQLANSRQNAMNLTGTPMMQPNPLLNFNSNPVNAPAINPQINPNINPVISPVNNPVNTFNPSVNVVNTMPNIEVKTKRTITRSQKFGIDPVPMNCPFCENPILTQVEKSTNMKAMCAAIGLCYVGFVCLQSCKKKAVGCDDFQHSCPKCGNIIGTYHAM